MELELGEQFQINVTVKNKGDGKTTEIFYVKYLLSDDEAFSENDGEFSVENSEDKISTLLDPGDTKDEEIIVSAPDTPGVYYVGAWADYKDEIEEDDESNNFSDSDDEIATIKVAEKIPFEAIWSVITNLLMDEDETPPPPDVLGNLDGDDYVTVSDAVLALKILSGNVEAGDVGISGDVNGDKKIGLAEFVYILQKICGLR